MVDTRDRRLCDLIIMNELETVRDFIEQGEAHEILRDKVEGAQPVPVYRVRTQASVSKRPRENDPSHANTKRRAAECYNCNQIGHYIYQCPTVVCHECGVTGHTQKLCPKKRAPYREPRNLRHGAPRRPKHQLAKTGGKCSTTGGYRGCVFSRRR